jgi:hypothetical protein
MYLKKNKKNEINHWTLKKEAYKFALKYNWQKKLWGLGT